MIENILQKEKINDRSKVVMIGDRDHDLGAARIVGVQAVGVLYGFGKREELESCQPRFIVDNVAELHNVLHQF